MEQDAIRAVRDYLIDLLQKEDYCQASLVEPALRILVNSSRNTKLNAMGYGAEIKETIGLNYGGKL